MGQSTFEGIVEHGRIRLKDSVHLPENTRVVVIVPQNSRPIIMPSPRLAHPEDASHFVLDVVEEDPSAGV